MFFKKAPRIEKIRMIALDHAVTQGTAIGNLLGMETGALLEEARVFERYLLTGENLDSSISVPPPADRTLDF